ncbi:MAG: hypothetical protein ACRERV_13345 [Methylococcales bacterium]
MACGQVRADTRTTRRDESLLSVFKEFASRLDGSGNLSASMTTWLKHLAEGNCMALLLDGE